MLSTMRQAWLLYALFALIALTSALNIDGIEAYLHHGVVKRQANTGSPSSASATEEPAESSDVPEPSSQEPESTPDSTPTPSAQPSQQPSSNPQPSQTADPTSNPPASQPGSTKAPASTPGPTSQPTSDDDDTRTATTPVIKTTPLWGTSVQDITITYTSIVDGQTQISVGTQKSTATFSTGAGTVTEEPLPQSGSGNDDGSGLSDNNKKIIGGVVGGVGGAILLGGLAIVWWRLRNKKQRVAEDDDDLMAGTGSALGDKSSHGTSGSPFQSNLEQYHNPGGRPNAASNF